MASEKMTAMRSMMTHEESKLKGLKPWRSRAWRAQKNKKAKRLDAQMAAGAARREARRAERAKAHNALLKQHATAKKVTA